MNGNRFEAALIAWLSAVMALNLPHPMSIAAWIHAGIWLAVFAARCYEATQPDRLAARIHGEANWMCRKHGAREMTKIVGARVEATRRMLDPNA